MVIFLVLLGIFFTIASNSYSQCKGCRDEIYHIAAKGFDDYKAFLHYGFSSKRLDVTRSFCKELQEFIKDHYKSEEYYDFIFAIQDFLLIRPELIHRIASVYFGLIERKGESKKSVISGLISAFKSVDFDLTKLHFVDSKSCQRILLHSDAGIL